MYPEDVIRKINNYYEEYKCKYNQENIIGIIVCESDDNTSMAYTNTPELKESIKNKEAVNLYVNPKLMNFSEDYIRAVLFHEFIHITDAYIFLDYKNTEILMSVYSEYHAKRVEIYELCRDGKITLDKKINGENGTTSLRKEIESGVEWILDIFDAMELGAKQVEESFLYCFNQLITQYAYLFAHLSLVEDIDKKYCESCLNRVKKYEKWGITEELYLKVKNLEDILKNPSEMDTLIFKLYDKCLEA